MFHGIPNCHREMEGSSRRRRISSLQAGRSLAAIIAVLAVISTLGGCAGSAPRFRSSPEESERRLRDRDEARLAPKIKEEETREDDHKVDIQRIRRKYTSGVTYSNITPAGVNRDRVLLDVVAYLGVPYEYGGTSKEGMDCSAFTARVYEEALGKAIPRSTEGQFQIGNDIKKEELQFGDLVFFNTTGRTPSHVGIYIEDDLFAHASVTYGITFSSLESTYYKNRFVAARRIVP